MYLLINLFCPWRKPCRARRRGFGPTKVAHLIERRARHGQKFVKRRFCRSPHGDRQHQPATPRNTAMGQGASVIFFRPSARLTQPPARQRVMQLPILGFKTGFPATRNWPFQSAKRAVTQRYAHAGRCRQRRRKHFVSNRPPGHMARECEPDGRPWLIAAHAGRGPMPPVRARHTLATPARNIFIFLYMPKLAYSN